jgi:glutamyl-tRNA reductase
VAVAGRNIDHAKRCAAGAGVDATCVEALPEIAKDACLILAFKGTPTPVMYEYITRAAQQAALVIDLTMPPFDWSDASLQNVVDLESMARADLLSEEDRDLQERLSAAARAAVGKLWERRFADGAAPRLYRRVEQLRIREVARAAKQPNADVDQMDVVTKALIKQIFHRYAQALRDDEDTALIEATEELFRFEEN